MTDLETRFAERQLATLGARGGRPAVIRPTEEVLLPSDPWDGEERVYSFQRSAKGFGISATGGMKISLVGPNRGATSVENGRVVPESHGELRLLRLMAFPEEKAWVNTLIVGTWTVT